MQLKNQLLTWVVLFALGVLPASAQSYLSESNPMVAAGFGGSAAIGDGEIIVGSVDISYAPGDLIVFRESDGQWVESGRISASDGINDNRFGRALAMNGSTLLVGATKQDDPTGAAYIFSRDEDGNWKQQAKLVASEDVENFGRVVALNDEFAFVTTLAKGDNRGAVFVFHKEGDNTWVEHSILMPEDLSPEDYFGISLSLVGDRLVVGAPALGRQSYAGAVYVFEYDSATDEWKQETKLEANELNGRSWYGYASLLVDNSIVVGAPNSNGGTGSALIYSRSGETGDWQLTGQLLPFDGAPGTQFGSALAFTDTGLWVGAPRASNIRGAVYTFDYDFESGMWTAVKKLHATNGQVNSEFGDFFAVHGNVALIGAARADTGLGIAHVFERNEEGIWVERAALVKEEAGIDPVLGAQVDCDDGTASLFGCDNVDLLSFMPIKDVGGTRGIDLNDIWGWTDPESGVEYVLLGRTDGTSFVDISDPMNPLFVGSLPLTEGAKVASWRDVKVYDGYAFIVADGSGQHGVQIFDLSQLGSVEPESMPVTFEASALYDEVASVHNIVINEETGYAYAVGSNGGGNTCGGGLHIINVQDQLNPTFAGCFADDQTGRASTGYTHDAQCVIYNGPDTEHQGKEICIGANETALSIADVTDKENTIALSRTSYPNVAYSHQGWLTEDQKYFYSNDELDESSGNVTNTRTLIWDVQDLDDPQLLKEFFLETTAIDHNLYIKGNLMYQSNYNSGLRIFDITDIENPVPVGHFDTNPFDDGVGYDGSWSNYPFFKSGVIAVSSITQGLFLLKKSDIDI